MARGKVNLELEISEFAIIQKALENYKGKLTRQQQQNENSYEMLTRVVNEEKLLDKLMRELAR